jgi:peptidoglycan hydrolase-like protein with peptidoglycan-binding domain
MRTLIRKFLLGTGSVLALGMAGSVVSSLLDVPDAGNAATAASIPAVVETSRDALTGDALRRNDVRWAQVELRYRGLYQGSLDGIVGPETKRALSQFQKINGLGPSESLDGQTWRR